MNSLYKRLIVFANKNKSRARFYFLRGVFILSLPVFAGSLLLLFKTPRNLLILFGGFLAGKQLQAPIWHERIFNLSIKYLIISCLLIIISAFFNRILYRAKQIYNNQKYLRVLIITLAVLSAFNSLRYIDIPVSSADLDPSYAWSLNWLMHSGNFNYIADSYFHAGPFFFIFYGADYALNIALAFIANIACLTLVIFSIKEPFKKLSLKRQFAVILSIFLFASLAPVEWLWNFTVFVSALNCLKTCKTKAFMANTALFAVLCAVSLMIKFNTAAFAGCMALMLGILLLYLEIKQAFVYAACFAVIYCAITLINISIFFKSISNFLVFIKMAIEFSSGYNYAMCTIGPAAALLFALAVIACYFFAIIKAHKQNHNLFLYLLSGIPLVFFSFKHGFVRQDWPHTISFFMTMPLLLALIIIFTDVLPKKLRAFYAVVCACSFLLIIDSNQSYLKAYGNNLYNLVKLPHNILQFEERKKQAHEKNVLSAEWNDIINGNSIQIMPWEFSYAAANNWTGWRPKPPPQNFVAWIKEFDDLSAASFLDANAPQFILQEFKNVDGRNLFLDTPAVWNAIIPNYRTVKSDDKRILLKKNDSHNTLNLAHIKTEEYKWNETITLPEYNKDIYAKINIEASVLGKIITVLFRREPPKIILTTKEGGSHTYRIITETLETPVLISRVPNDFNQMKAFFEGKTGDAFVVTDFLFTNSLPFMYKNNFTVDWFQKEP
ncbi:MAG: hypothetical protein Pg6A_12350 [Termitinemataceae bacterium]|nr:MAG: hypothetical protein Pg6A_12350 [Termitinemataceae bacterium]